MAAGFSTSTNTRLTGNTITGPWRNGIVTSPPFYPARPGNAPVAGNRVSGLRPGRYGFRDDSEGFTATLSDNSWQ